MNTRFEQIGILLFIGTLTASVYALFAQTDSVWRICQLMWFTDIVVMANVISDICHEKNRKGAAIMFGLIRNATIGTILSLLSGMIEHVNPALIVILISFIISAVGEYLGYTPRRLVEWIKKR